MQPMLTCYHNVVFAVCMLRRIFTQDENCLDKWALAVTAQFYQCEGIDYWPFQHSRKHVFLPRQIATHKKDGVPLRLGLAYSFLFPLNLKKNLPATYSMCMYTVQDI